MQVEETADLTPIQLSILTNIIKQIYLTSFNFQQMGSCKMVKAYKQVCNLHAHKKREWNIWH